jgi:hypothetical protein
MSLPEDATLDMVIEEKKPFHGPHTTGASDVSTPYVSSTDCSSSDEVKVWPSISGKRGTTCGRRRRLASESVRRGWLRTGVQSGFCKNPCAAWRAGWLTLASPPTICTHCATCDRLPCASTSPPAHPAGCACTAAAKPRIVLAIVRASQQL